MSKQLTSLLVYNRAEQQVSCSCGCSTCHQITVVNAIIYRKALLSIPLTFRVTSLTEVSALYKWLTCIWQFNFCHLMTGFLFIMICTLSFTKSTLVSHFLDKILYKSQKDLVCMWHLICGIACVICLESKLQTKCLRYWFINWFPLTIYYSIYWFLR